METSQNTFNQGNILNNLDIFNNQKVTETINNLNSIANQETAIVEDISSIPNTDLNQNKEGEAPYTFVGDFNFSNSGATTELKNTNVDLFINNNQNTLNSETANTQVITQNPIEVPKTENLNTNFDLGNLNSNLPGKEEKYTFDGNIFDINNNNTLTEQNYSDNANIFGNNNFNFEGNNNFNADLLNAYTFGELGQNAQPTLENPQTNFTENQNVYHEHNSEQPKIENEQTNLNTNNIIGNENKENENLLSTINNDINIKSPFEAIKENKTLLLENKPTIENNNNGEEKLESFPGIKNENEKKEEEINTNILPNENNQNQNKNDIQLNNNILNNIEEPPKVEENKLVDISDEIKEIKEMPEKPFEQRDVIFNKNNIKVIKIEDDETTFCTGILSPLFKKIFG